MKRALRQLAAVLGLALLPALVSGFVQLRWAPPPPPSGAGEVTLAMVEPWGDQVLWVDARSRAKYDHAHIPGALLLNEDEWNALIAPFLDAWDPVVPVVIYCDGGTCEASHKVAGRLRAELQIERVHILKGGWSAWSAR